MKISRFLQPAALGMLIIAGFSTSVSAAGTSTSTKTTTQTDTSSQQASSGSSVQSYAATSVLETGTIVQLSNSKVSAASSKNLQQMYGVVVDPHQLSLTISDASLANETYVATSGTYEVLVDTQSGTIKQGDYVTLSSVDGVAMKADTSQKTVFGRAAVGFDGKDNAIGSTTLKLSDGSSEKVSIGIIQVAINIQRNPDEKSTTTDLPKALQRVGEAIADKPVGPLRIYLSIAVTGLSIIVAIVALYSGIRNAMVAIGRNPLSKKSIFRALLEVILTGFLILIIGLFAVYLLLKL